jgi:hypothetical protein
VGGSVCVVADDHCAVCDNQSWKLIKWLNPANNPYMRRFTFTLRGGVWVVERSLSLRVATGYAQRATIETRTRSRGGNAGFLNWDYYFNYRRYLDNAFSRVVVWLSINNKR